MSNAAPEAPPDAIPEWATVGSRATWARHQAGLSVRRAAELAGLSMGEVDVVEMGARELDGIHAERRMTYCVRQLAPVYGVSVDWLREGTVPGTTRAAALDTIGMMTRAGMSPPEQRRILLFMLCQPDGASGAVMSGHRAIQAHKGGSP